jgi:hypothetical protein
MPRGLFADIQKAFMAFVFFNVFYKSTPPGDTIQSPKEQGPLQAAIVGHNLLNRVDFVNRKTVKIFPIQTVP